MPSGTYRYEEVHNVSPTGFGEELTRVLNQLRDDSWEIVSISMSLAKLGPVASDYEHSSRVAQIVAFRSAPPDSRE